MEGSFWHALMTSVGVTALLTSIFALKFRYWRRPVVLTIYALVFFVIEWVGHRYFLPEDLFGAWLGYLCLALTVPVVVAIVLLDRYERKMGVAD